MQLGGIIAELTHRKEALETEQGLAESALCQYRVVPCLTG
jgi:hypothetical protein